MPQTVPFTLLKAAVNGRWMIVIFRFVTSSHPLHLIHTKYKNMQLWADFLQQVPFRQNYFVSKYLLHASLYRCNALAKLLNLHQEACHC